MPHVLCLRAIHPDAIALMRSAAGVTVEVLDPVTPESLHARIAEADAITVRLARIDAALIARAPRLRIVARHGVGYDAVDVPALTARGIPLTITPEANAGSVAEHALMLMLACARRVTGYDARLRDLAWGATPDLPTVDLAGRTVLLIGFGRIGTRVAKLCTAFGMRVLVSDPAVPWNTIKGLGLTPVEDLRAALGEADVVTLHCPGSAENRDMVDAGFLAAMKPGAMLINTARGTLVDEHALAASLRGGHLSAAGLDVFEEEPAVAANPLLGLANAILTPHSAAGTAEGMRRMAMSCAESILARFAGTLDPHVVVNPEVLQRNA
jgi:D-3-phosphoglycerate dehydrogenase